MKRKIKLKTHNSYLDEISKSGNEGGTGSRGKGGGEKKNEKAQTQIGRWVQPKLTN